jgi:hypothetical protein
LHGLSLSACASCALSKIPQSKIYFFEQQDHARRQTKILVLLFALAVLAIVLAVNFVMALLWILIQGQP